MYMTPREVFWQYGGHFMRVLGVVAVNIAIAHFLLASELFGDYRVTVKIMFLLSGFLVFCYPRLSTWWQGQCYSRQHLLAVLSLAMVTGVLLGGYILGLDLFSSSWQLQVSHPLYLFLPGILVFVALQMLFVNLRRMPRGEVVLERLSSVSYALYAVALLVLALLLPKMSFYTLLLVFLATQLVVLALAWWVYQMKSREGMAKEVPAESIDLLQQTSFAMGLLMMEWLYPDEHAVTQYAIIMVLCSLLYVATQPFMMTLRKRSWSADSMHDAVKLIWLNVLFASGMYALLMFFAKWLLISLFASMADEALFTLYFALSVFFLIACLQPFFTLLLFLQPRLCQPLLLARLIGLAILLFIVVPPFGLYGALMAEMLTCIAFYGGSLIYMIEKDIFPVDVLMRIDL